MSIESVMDDARAQVGLVDADAPVMLVAVQSGGQLKYVVCDATGFGKPYPDFAREFFAPAYAQLTQKA